MDRAEALALLLKAGSLSVTLSVIDPLLRWTAADAPTNPVNSDPGRPWPAAAAARDGAVATSTMIPVRSAIFMSPWIRRRRSSIPK